IIKEKTTKPPYNFSASEEEIVDSLKTIARQGIESITEKEYSEWFRQQLNQTQFSKLEFMELARMNVLRQKLREYLATRAPTVSEQVHLHMIIQKSPKAMQKVRQRLDAGEDFFQLAKELNPSLATRENQGDLGWQTKNGLDRRLADVAFQLEVGMPSNPFPLSKEAFAIVMVKEKAAAREMSKEMQERQKFGLVEQWASKEFQYHKISYHGLTEGKGWDSETNAWANWQMQRLNSETESEK
ncbi:MAG: peptidylprolyl isomerase, partial [Desulfatiglandales bacterium]|nr:peptidylprolyl isomerase [Desulfatiglandales bacterium]